MAKRMPIVLMITPPTSQGNEGLAGSPVNARPRSPTPPERSTPQAMTSPGSAPDRAAAFHTA